MAAISRAMPRTDRQSGRLGVTSTSSTWSEMGKYSIERRARLPLVGQHHGAGALGGQTDLGLGHDHPRGADPAQLGLLDAGAVGHDAARQDHGHGLAGGHVGRSAHDGARRLFAHVHQADRQLVGVGMALALEDLADHEVLQVLAAGDAGLGHPLHLGAGEGQYARPARPRDDSMDTYSCSQDRGAFMCAPYQNWRRKRRSFSKNRRRSLTPCLSMAIRSMPMPKAKPV